MIKQTLVNKAERADTIILSVPGPGSVIAEEKELRVSLLSCSIWPNNAQEIRKPKCSPSSLIRQQCSYGPLDDRAKCGKLQSSTPLYPDTLITFAIVRTFDSVVGMVSRGFDGC